MGVNSGIVRNDVWEGVWVEEDRGDITEYAGVTYTSLIIFVIFIK